MASARDIRRRIKSVKSTQQITKAMKMVAAAKLRKAQDKVVAARPFSKKLNEVLGRLAQGSAGFSHPLLEVREPKSIGYVIVTADRGLCGGYNANVIRTAFSELKQLENVALISVGRKGRDFFRRRGYEIKKDFIGLGEDIDFGVAKDIAKTVMDYYTEGVFDEVYLVYSEFVTAMTQRPVTMKLLPVETPQEENTSGEYIYEPSAEAILSVLLPKYVETTIYRALLEAKAGEHGARMTAMGSATDNATEMIDKLTLSLNKARQAAITKELSEVVGGANALD